VKGEDVNRDEDEDEDENMGADQLACAITSALGLAILQARGCRRGQR